MALRPDKFAIRDILFCTKNIVFKAFKCDSNSSGMCLSILNDKSSVLETTGMRSALTYIL